jgi:hypothetical protein
MLGHGTLLDMRTRLGHLNIRLQVCIRPFVCHETNITSQEQKSRYTESWCMPCQDLSLVRSPSGMLASL